MSADIPEEKPVNPNTEDSHTHESDQQPPNPPSTIATKSYVPPPEANYARTKRTKDSDLDWARFFVEVLTLLALVWYACIANRQLAEMHTATVAATQSANTARDALIWDQRAWVTVRSVKLQKPLTINKPIIADVEIINSGKTPAINTIVSGNVASREVASKDFLDAETTGEPLSRTVIGPGATATMFLDTGEPVRNSVEINVLSTTYTLYVRGKIQYETMGQVHTTKFCLKLPPKDYALGLNAFTGCEVGNTAE